MKLKKLIIFGAGEGSAEVLKILIEDINSISPTWEVLGFKDIKENKNPELFGYPIIINEYDSISTEVYGICSVMDNELRFKIINKEIISKGYNLASLIHPSVEKAKDFKHGDGLIIFPGTKISYGVEVGTGVYLNYNSMIGHDVKINNYTFVAPSATINARCNIGNKCVIGSGATIAPGVSVGNNSIIGLGSSLFGDVPDNMSVVDYPKKITKQR